MADIIVQPKVLNADGVTYDSLIMQNAVNSTNAIKKDDNSGYNGFTQNVTSGIISTTDGYIIPIKQNLSFTQSIEGEQTYDKYCKLVLTNYQLRDGDKIELHIQYNGSGEIYRKYVFTGVVKMGTLYGRIHFNMLGSTTYSASVSPVNTIVSSLTILGAIVYTSYIRLQLASMVISGQTIEQPSPESQYINVTNVYKIID